MPSALSPEQQLLRDTCRRFVADIVRPSAPSWDRAESFPHSVIDQAAALGLLGVCIPSEYDGAGLGNTELALVIEELAQGDGSVALTVASHNGLCAGHILAAGTPAQKKTFLPALATGEALGAWALTEPNSGSDAAGMLTTATFDGSLWQLNGSKTFITQGTVGHTYVILAQTDQTKKTRGITAFIVPADAPGFSRAPLKEKLGMRGSDTATLNFDAICLPDEARLGEVGRGFIDTLKVLDKGRISIAALSVGLAQAAFDEARRYATERQQFGQPIAHFQAIQFKLADMATQIHAARLMTREAAALADSGAPFSQEASMAKLFASEVACKVCDEALQIHGGYGYTAEFPVERFLRDARLLTIGEGTSEVQRLVIAKHLLEKVA